MPLLIKSSVSQTGPSSSPSYPSSPLLSLLVPSCLSSSSFSASASSTRAGLLLPSVQPSLVPPLFFTVPFLPRSSSAALFVPSFLPGSFFRENASKFYGQCSTASSFSCLLGFSFYSDVAVDIFPSSLLQCSDILSCFLFLFSNFL